MIALRGLTPAGDHLMTDGRRRWPVIDGVPYLRAGREAIRDGAVRRIEAGDVPGARAVLLSDQDPFAPEPPPSEAQLRDVAAGVDAGRVGLRAALDGLGFGRVADYFALRPSVPTFLSGLALVSQHGGGLPVVEVACGIGQLLRVFQRHGLAVAGVDLVWSKLWLARRFVVPGATLVCADVCGWWPLAGDGAVTVLCHDAFYFLPDMPAALVNMQALWPPSPPALRGGGAGGEGDSHRPTQGRSSGPSAIRHPNAAGIPLSPGPSPPQSRGGGGQGAPPLDGTDTQCLGGVLIGHAHNRLVDHGVSGFPRTPAEYAALAPDAILYDDAAFAAAHRSGVAATPHRPESLAGVEAVSLVIPPTPAAAPDRFAVPPAGTRLVPNPLLTPAGPRWPHPRFAAEYAAADYLTAAGDPVRSRHVLPAEDVV